MNELQKAQLAVEQANQAVLAASETIQKLVAENAALKQSEIDLDLTCAEEWGDNWVNELTETPATDAAIAEIKAQGVDELIDKLRTSDNVDEHAWNSVYFDIEKFAANLRAGRKG